MNDGTIARKDDIRIGSQSGTRLTVNRFARSTTSNFPGQFWVQENTTKGPFDLRKLNEATFVARGQGLTNVRLRFNSGSEDWVSEPIVLSDHFQPCRINLNALWENKMAGSQFISQGLSRVDDKPQTISIQVGQYVNAFRSQGFVEVSEIQFK